MIIGGGGPENLPAVPANVKGTPLMVNGVLYVTSPDNAWALDARDGRELWHYFWRTKGSTPIANRGVGIWKDYLYFVTPDNFFVSLDAKTGKERWNKEHADFDQQYFSTMAPIVDGQPRDRRHRQRHRLARLHPVLRSRNRRGAVALLHGADEGRRSRARHVAEPAGGQVRRRPPWLPGVYDPETRLYIFGTGNPIPAYTAGRGEGDNLYTCSLIAVNVDTGKMAWAFQTSPHDMHDWDSAQTPILFEATIKGKPRKLVSTAARNGYFFTVDRVTGEHIVTTSTARRPTGPSRWTRTVRSAATRSRTRRSGALTSPTSGGTINWEPPAYSPDTKLFYVTERNGFSIYYLTDPDPRGSMGLGGKEEVSVGSTGNYLTAIDPTTGKIVWRRPYPGAAVGLAAVAVAAAC